MPFADLNFILQSIFLFGKMRPLSIRFFKAINVTGTSLKDCLTAGMKGSMLFLIVFSNLLKIELIDIWHLAFDIVK